MCQALETGAFHERDPYKCLARRYVSVLFAAGKGNDRLHLGLPGKEHQERPKRQCECCGQVQQAD